MLHGPPDFYKTYRNIGLHLEKFEGYSVFCVRVFTKNHMGKTECPMEGSVKQ